MRQLLLVSLLGFAVVLSGCSTSGGVAPVEERTGQEGENGENSGLSQDEINAQEGAEGENGEALAEGENINQSDPLAVEEAWNDPANPISQRVIYFDYDSNSVREEYQETLNLHAEYIRRRPDMVVILEGHTDERGSREYNIALGDRRAQSIKRAMVVRGVKAEQVRTVSFGEEKPAETGESEAQWAQNRRVVIIYGE